MSLHNTSSVPRWKLPPGKDCLPTVPRFRLPDFNKDKPAFEQFLETNKDALLAALRHGVTEYQLEHVNSTQKRFFFVDHACPNLREGRKPAHKALRKSVDSFSLPSSNVLTLLHQRAALSLPDVMKLALAFEAAVTHGNRGAITYFTLERKRKETEEGLGTKDEREPWNPLCPTNGQAIVPALRSVDPEKLRKIRTDLGATDAEFNAFLGPTGRRLPAGFFSAYLEVGYRAGNGGRQGYYLLTEPTAQAVHDYFVSRASNGSNVPPINELFPDDPSKFPGKGLYCTPLPIRWGNFLS